MNTATNFEEQLEELSQKINDSVLSYDDKSEIEKVRENFVQTYSLGKIFGLTVEDYFRKYGKTEGCFEYDLEITTKALGDISGGLINKFGEEAEFSKIKTLFQKIIWLDTFKAYNAEGVISAELEAVVLLAKDIEGMSTDKTVIPKLLSIFFPEVFLPIFNEQEFFLKKILKDNNSSEQRGLANYVENNFKLLNIKKELEALAETKLDGYTFSKLLNDTYRTDLEISNQQQPTYVIFDEAEKETASNLEESYFDNSPKENQEINQENHRASSFLQDADDDKEEEKKLFTTPLLEVSEREHAVLENYFETNAKVEEKINDSKNAIAPELEQESQVEQEATNIVEIHSAPTYLEKYESVKTSKDSKKAIKNKISIPQIQITMEELEINRFLLHSNKAKFLPNLNYFDSKKQDAVFGQYDTESIGIIDTLAVDENGDFVVIEFKRDDNNECIGKILRFMGWTQNQLCKNGQVVRGIIISNESDTDLELLAKAVPNLMLMKLSVTISLTEF